MGSRGRGVRSGPRSAWTSGTARPGRAEGRAPGRSSRSPRARTLAPPAPASPVSEGAPAPSPRAPRDALPVFVKETLLRRGRHEGTSAFKAPNQGKDRSFGYWVAWPRLTEKYCFVQRRRYGKHMHLPRTIPSCVLQAQLPLKYEDA